MSAISPLRRRMIEDMTVRNFAAKTQTDYIRRVKNFAVFLGRSPDTATREEVRGDLLHLASSGMRAPTVNGTGSALRFLFDRDARSCRDRQVISPLCASRANRRSF